MNLNVHSISMCFSTSSLFDDLSLSFSEGKLYGLIGPNGTGKTTFLKILCRLLLPSKGSITLNDTSLCSFSRKELSQKIAYVPQCPTLSFPFTARELVEMAGYAKNTHTLRVDDCLSMAGALSFKDRIVHTLSQGERQRVYIARALYTEAPFLLLDEPTASLDREHQEGIWQLLHQLTKEGKGVIAATHDLAFAPLFSHKLLLREGKISINGDS